MKNTQTNDSFDLPAYLLEITYGMMDGKDIANWSMDEARLAARDLALCGIEADADEIYETVAGFIAQDAGEAE